MRPAGEPTRAHPAHAAGVALGYLVASPVLVLKGMAEGIAATPFFVNTDTNAMNDAMVRAGAPVDLARTYRYAYGQNLAKLSQGVAGRVFRRLAPATRHFRSVLRGYGISNADDYLLAAVRTADAQGYTLYAVIHRPEKRIRVRTEDGRIATLTPNDDAYYRPYAGDAANRPLDVVIDWAAVSRTAIRTQKGQAIMMTFGANSVLINRRSDEFWAIEQRWRGGAFREITRSRKAALDHRIR